MLQDGCFIDKRDARTEILDFIEAYYNTLRKHFSPPLPIPAQFEAHLYSLN